MGADEQLVPQVAHPGQRPVLFPSPYEVATWSVVPASGFADAWLGHPEHRGVDHAARYYGLRDDLDEERRRARRALAAVSHVGARAHPRRRRPRDDDLRPRRSVRS